jgi:hypothetical protein
VKSFTSKQLNSYASLSEVLWACDDLVELKFLSATDTVRNFPNVSSLHYETRFQLCHSGPLGLNFKYRQSTINKVLDNFIVS